MTWECLNCGLFNDDDADKECFKCGMDKAEAMTVVVNKKKFCPECGHMHKWNIRTALQGFVEEDDEEEEEVTMKRMKKKRMKRKTCWVKQ